MAKQKHHKMQPEAGWYNVTAPKSKPNILIQVYWPKNIHLHTYISQE